MDTYNIYFRYRIKFDIDIPSSRYKTKMNLRLHELHNLENLHCACIVIIHLERLAYKNIS